MKCDCCEKQIENGESYFDPVQFNLFVQVICRKADSNRLINFDYKRINALCRDCVEDAFVTYDKVGEEIDEGYQE